jgi:hypothetical protein
MNRTLVTGAVVLTSLLFVSCKEKPYQLPKLGAIRAAQEARKQWLIRGNNADGFIEEPHVRITDTIHVDSLVHDTIPTDSMTKDSI